MKVELLYAQEPVITQTSWDSVKVHRLTKEGGATFQVRTVVHRNSYDFQSRYQADVWTSVGWSLLVGYPGTSPGLDMPNVHAADHARTQASIRLHEMLLADAAAILGGE